MSWRRDPIRRAAIGPLAAATLGWLAASAARAEGGAHPGTDADPGGAAASEMIAPSDSAIYRTVVRAHGGGPPQPVSATVDGDQARALPGSGGDPSVAAQDLPGVARPAPGATGLVLWGASPNESRVLFDDVEIPALYHFGGFRSTVGAELVGRIELVPGAYGAEYGRALGGLVRVDARPLEGGGGHLSLDANLLDVSVAARAGREPGLRVAVAARTSYLDATYGRLTSTGASSALFPIPRYSDAQLEVAFDVATGATLRAFALTSFDHVRREPWNAGAAPARVEDQAQSWWRAGLSYAERSDDDGLGATVFVGGERATLDQDFGPVPVSQAVGRTELGLRARYSARFGEAVRLAVGLDGLIEGARVRRTGSLSIPAREGDLTVFGQPPGADVNADSWSATVGDIAPFVTASLTRGDWTFRPGLRADAFPVDGNRALPPFGGTPLVGYAHLAWALDPRASVALEASPTLVVTAAAGLYHQPVDATDLSAVFGAPGLGPERAAHATLSAWKHVTEAIRVEVSAFYRHLDGLAVRSPLPTPLLAGALVPTGHGRSFGVNLMVRRELSAGTLAWLTYTVGRSERSIDGGAKRLLDFDQTHVVTAIASHQWRAWTLSGRARYATGMPRTPVIGAFLDVREGLEQPVFGAQNSARLPSFFQLDARVERAVIAGPVGVTVYLDVQNVTARRNAEEIVYSHDFTSAGYVTGPPLLVLFGVRIAS